LLVRGGFPFAGQAAVLSRWSSLCWPRICSTCGSVEMDGACNGPLKWGAGPMVLMLWLDAK
jgi:hypothetical protein